ncbi:hypothetical protein [Paenibacillus sacheonensis]|uniref:Uncharacterized protein n=1 Tax=Paenibacillus sacheonensis TaxID=742054 RepID=A0A7X4YPI5_9BACL|nr:hypothetical protein [Paenibacillus sacheonensis]MBM7564818.1 hypothetical protein [Paenibacillus sacheonensis]NBC69366.1 hypothetical protein [Paenibacillus sacheonensis]
MLQVTIKEHSPYLVTVEPDRVYSDRPYQYSITAGVNGQAPAAFDLSRLAWTVRIGAAEGRGSFGDSGITILQTFTSDGLGVAERISITNTNASEVAIDQAMLGFTAALSGRAAWRLSAIPFLIELDGTCHDFTVEQLLAGKAKNSMYVDASREILPFEEIGLRSEAWAWGDGDRGIVVIKYNNEQIEYAMARTDLVDGEGLLRFGGAGLALLGEPFGVRRLAPGQTFHFGQTHYYPYEGSIQTAYGLYRSFQESRGHTHGADYDPPVNWNELYDIGWHHSDAEQLKLHYHKEALLREAEKAKACGCELLYLDPGWEVAEGLTLWDDSRLGAVSDLVRELKDDYGLDLGYRTILRAYKPHWPERYFVEHSYGPMQPEKMEPVWGYHFWEMCLCDPRFYEEKLNRILAISKQGIRFMMFDEMDWRGPCYNPNHGHQVPSTPLDHVEAVYRLAHDVRAACPQVLTEVHDPVSPWVTSLYVPTYFHQGAPGIGSYDENWGFEYMWNCIEDLKTGKALALYYYNLGCSIPLYLHITMAADNDNSVFFWWCASTIRHLGIGGKTSHPSVEIAGALAPYDKEARFANYCGQMSVYKQLKPYFVRGAFHGIAEHIHLHALADEAGGVINVFNLTEEDTELTFDVPVALLGGESAPMPVSGAEAHWHSDGVTFSLRLGAMSPGVIAVGEAADRLTR